MTRATNARIAGATFLLYVALGIGQMVFGRSTRGGDIPARLAAVAAHSTEARIGILMSIVIGVVAMLLAVSLYGLTRDVDRDLSALGLACRGIEASLGFFPVAGLGMLWLATTGRDAVSGASAQALGTLLVQLGRWQVLVAATLFALGSTAFCWLLLRGRIIPRGLAWLGVGASVLLVLALPLQMAGYVSGMVAQLIWLPMALFEIPLGIWLLIRTPRSA